MKLFGDKRFLGKILHADGQTNKLKKSRKKKKHPSPVRRDHIPEPGVGFCYAFA